MSEGTKSFTTTESKVVMEVNVKAVKSLSFTSTVYISFGHSL